MTEKKITNDSECVHVSGFSAHIMYTSSTQCSVKRWVKGGYGGTHNPRMWKTKASSRPAWSAWFQDSHMSLHKDMLSQKEQMKMFMKINNK